MDLEHLIFTIISCSGSARSFAMEAIAQARKEDLAGAAESLQQAENKLAEAHKEQTNLIQSEARGEKTAVTLLLVHAQDHLMNAITIKQLAGEMVEMYATMERK